MARFAIIFICFIYQHSVGQSADSPDMLMHIEDQHLLATINHDTVALNTLYDDTFHGVLATGHIVNKPKVIDFLTSGSPHIQLFIEEVKASVFGPVAITTGKLVSKSKSGFVIGRSRFIRIYIKKGGQWKIIESQGTVILQE